MGMTKAQDNWRNFRSDQVVSYSPEMEEDSDVDSLDGLIDSHFKNILKSDAEAYILRYDDCALRFLRLIAGGVLDFGRQERLVLTLRNLHQSCYSRTGRSAEVRYELTKTLDILAVEVKSIFKRHDWECTISDEELGEVSSDYGFHSAVRHGLGVARSAAMAAFTKGFAERFAAIEHPADLVGEWKLAINGDVFPELKDNIAGIHGENSQLQIVKAPGKSVYELKFLEFPPLLEPWYTLEEMAYNAAAPILAKALGTTVTPVGKLWN